MKTYPLESLTVAEAAEKQYQLVDCIMQHFTGTESLSRGDLGVRSPYNMPITTAKAEKAIAQFFNSEAAIMVRGAGTGAIRYALSALFKAGDKVLVHTSPIYPTTAVSFEMLGLKIVFANFNDLNDIRRVLNDEKDIKGALIQYSRQTLDDAYDMSSVIKVIKEYNLPIITDDNYVVMKVRKIGTELDADLSCFSCFKLQGPEGIGIVVGKEEFISKIRAMHYSGGTQTQGWEALEVLRGLVYAPVMLALTNENTEKVLERLNAGEILEVEKAYIANAQSKVLLVRFKEPIAKRVLLASEKLGALPNPVGAESKYELVPLFYRVSGTNLKKDPSLADYMIRINPNRAGAQTVIRILKESIREAKNV